MFLNQLGPSPEKKIAKINKMLSEQFGMKVSVERMSKAKLESLLESATESLITIRGTNKKFHLDPEYAKFLGIKGVIETVIKEGMYAESPAYQEMQDFVTDNVHELMDAGYSLDDTVREVMNRYRLDSRYAYPDAHVREIVMKCATDYIDSFSHEQAHAEIDQLDIHDMEEPMGEIMLSPRVFEAIAMHYGVRPKTTTAKRVVENKIQQFARATKKNPATIVEFLNSLSSKKLNEGIVMFSKKAQKLTEAVDVDQAEVIVAAKSMSSALQDQVEKLGRMLNEDLPAIVEQLRADMGAQSAASFSDSVSRVLSGHLEATKQAQQSLDQALSVITGEEAAAPVPAAPQAGAGEEEDLGLSDVGAEGEEAPEGEPGLGRAEI